MVGPCTLHWDSTIELAEVHDKRLLRTPCARPVPRPLQPPAHPGNKWSTGELAALYTARSGSSVPLGARSGAASMPVPRQMRWKEGDGPVKVGGNREVEEIVRDLRSGSNVQAARAAEELYMLTSFASAVSIDDKSALTTYDAKVFGTSAEGAENASDAASVSVEGSLQVPMNPEEVGGDVHVDGKRYLMGDGFMLMENTPDGSKDSDGARARRVAVSHSRCCIENRVLIGRAQGVFEGLVHVLEQGSSDGQLQASRALSQIAFRNAENKRAYGAIPGALRALGGVVQRALAAGEKRPLAEACRALGVLVAGDADNQEQAGMDKELVQARASSSCAEPAPRVPPAPQAHARL